MKILVLSILVLSIAAFINAAPNTKGNRDTELAVSV